MGDEVFRRLASPLEVDLAQHGLTTQRSRGLLAGAELAKDELAADDLCRALERLYLETGGRTPGKAFKLRKQWRRAYRKLLENRQHLEEHGSVHRRSGDLDLTIFSLKFRKPRDGKMVQSAIYLGPAPLDAMALEVLLRWRQERAGEPVRSLERPPTPQRRRDPLREAGGEGRLPASTVAPGPP